ncbi:uncharacterized protein EI90DRAFT_3017511 [Cantharellus anzutake]|uniref:uncharacterized protein n=1 Tax=Cantharellus anzutake TaxID=1750568 RepID=UPI001906A603|nr:uncharacterized protein EI90DRAFT_3017511 [Cantharellus anzutake]KAF8328920.1 hypothetical protein EI90DRAFT_3017511 [Cantharellus anzutake]
MSSQGAAGLSSSRKKTKTVQKSAQELDPVADVGEPNAAPIDPDPIGSPNAPPDELDSSGVVADTEVPATITADLDNVLINTETQSAARGTGPTSPVPLPLPLPLTMSSKSTGTNNPPVNKQTAKGDLPFSVVIPPENVLWKELIQIMNGFHKQLDDRMSAVTDRLDKLDCRMDALEDHQEITPGRIPQLVGPSDAMKTSGAPEGPLESTALCDQGMCPMVMMTQNLHDNDNMPIEYIHVPGSGYPGVQIATIFPDLESEKSASSLAWIPSHLKEKWVNKDCIKLVHSFRPPIRPPDDGTNTQGDDLQKAITEMLGQAVEVVVQQLAWLKDE